MTSESAAYEIQEQEEDGTYPSEKPDFNDVHGLMSIYDAHLIRARLNRGKKPDDNSFFDDSGE